MLRAFFNSFNYFSPVIIGQFMVRAASPFLASPSRGQPVGGLAAAAGAVRLALLPDDAPTGEFVSRDGRSVPW